SRTDESSANPRLVLARHREALEVDEERGLGKLLQHAGLAPLFQIRRGTGVDIIGVGIVRLRLTADNADNIIGMQSIVSILHLLGYLVVRLCDNFLNRDAVERVSQAAERKNLRHGHHCPTTWVELAK